jgi:hypothetical protein
MNWNSAYIPRPLSESEKQFVLQSEHSRNKIISTACLVARFIFVCLPPFAFAVELVKTILNGMFGFGQVMTAIGLVFYCCLFHKLISLLQKCISKTYSMIEAGDVLCLELPCLEAIQIYRHNETRCTYYVDVCIEDTIYRIPATRNLYERTEQGTPLLVVSWDNFKTPHSWHAYRMDEVRDYAAGVA